MLLSFLDGWVVERERMRGLGEELGGVAACLGSSLVDALIHEPMLKQPCFFERNRVRSMSARAELRSTHWSKIRSANPSHYLIRVNRQPCPADQVLREGDRISITPTKIEGAIR